MAEPRTDVVVVGAGPAGLTAAIEAAAAGCAVTVVDRDASPGGQYHRQPAVGASAASRPALLARVAADPRVEVRSGTTVWAAEVDGDLVRLHLTPTDPVPGAEPSTAGTASLGGVSSAGTLVGRIVVVASGAVDRALPFPGWDLPGVVTAGAAQTLLKAQGVLLGARVVVGGSGPFLLPVAAGLATAGAGRGARVLGVAEASRVGSLVRHAGTAARHPRTVADAARYLGVLARHRVPLWSGRAVVAASGDGRVEEVTTADLDATWRPLPGTERIVAADAVAVSFGFVPQVDLALALGCAVAPDPDWGDPAVVVDERQVTSRAGVLAAGEVTGVGGALAAAAEGGIAGVAAARLLGRLDGREAAVRARPHQLARRRQRGFTRLLATSFDVRPGWTSWLRDATVVCRCEEVPVAAVRRALAAGGASDLRSVKLTTRCGMGRCQARMCGPAVAALVAEATGAPPADPAGLSGRPLLAPVSLSRLAALDPAEEPLDPTEPHGPGPQGAGA